MKVYLTKEAMAQMIQGKQLEMARSFGLTYEQYQQAVISGSIVQPNQNINEENSTTD